MIGYGCLEAVIYRCTTKPLLTAKHLRMDRYKLTSRGTNPRSLIAVSSCITLTHDTSCLLLQNYKLPATIKNDSETFSLGSREHFEKDVKGVVLHWFDMSYVSREDMVNFTL